MNKKIKVFLSTLQQASGTPCWSLGSATGWKSWSGPWTQNTFWTRKWKLLILIKERKKICLTVFICNLKGKWAQNCDSITHVKKSKSNFKNRKKQDKNQESTSFYKRPVLSDQRKRLVLVVYLIIFIVSSSVLKEFIKTRGTLASYL